MGEEEQQPPIDWPQDNLCSGGGGGEQTSHWWCCCWSLLSRGKLTGCSRKLGLLSRYPSEKNHHFTRAQDGALVRGRGPFVVEKGQKCPVNFVCYNSLVRLSAASLAAQQRATLAHITQQVCTNFRHNTMLCAAIHLAGTGGEKVRRLKRQHCILRMR